MVKFIRSDFDISCQDLAKLLLGCLLVRRLDNGHVLKGIIVETEAYLGGSDKASHSYQGRRTNRCEPMYKEPGTAYVYMTYGMYHCFNISSQGPGAAVLLRAVEPVEGQDSMSQLRQEFLSSRKNPRPVKTLKYTELCNGPSKLCISFNVSKILNSEDLVFSDKLWIEGGTLDGCRIVECPRIGIESAGTEWASKHLRYYVYGNQFVSKRNKICESQIDVR